MTSAPDSGWGRAARAAVTALIPTRGARLAQRGSNALLIMRQLWCTFLGAITMLWLPAVIVTSAGPSSIDGRIVAGVVVGLGAVAQLMAGAVVPPVSGPSTGKVRATAQRSFFVRVALAELAALVGFVGAALTGNLAVYLAGYVVTVAAMLDAAPSDRWLDERQRELDEARHVVDLRAALESSGLTR